MQYIDMVSGALVRNRFEEPIDFVVGDGAGIEKGDFLKLIDARKASGAVAIGDMCAGIAHREKIANDGRTRLALIQNSIVDAVASGAITVGHPVKMGLSNQVMAATSISGAAVIGYALETAAHGETFQLRFKIG